MSWDIYGATTEKVIGKKTAGELYVWVKQGLELSLQADGEEPPNYPLQGYAVVSSDNKLIFPKSWPQPELTSEIAYKIRQLTGVPEKKLRVEFTIRSPQLS